MKKTMRLGSIFAIFVVLVSCASLQPQVPAPAGPGEKTVTIEASSYKFTPNNIKAVQGDTLLFTITNVADSSHNFTLTDSQGNKLQDVDLPAKKTISVPMTFSKPGKYEFYCNKPFHPTLGMKGQLEIAPNTAR